MDVGLDELREGPRSAWAAQPVQRIRLPPPHGGSGAGSQAPLGFKGSDCRASQCVMFLEWFAPRSMEGSRPTATAPSSQGVPACGARLARGQSADERKRATDSIRDAALPARLPSKLRCLDAEAELSSAEGQRDNQRSTNYVLGVVICSGALFFAGMSKSAARCASKKRCWRSVGCSYSAPSSGLRPPQ